MSYVLTGQVGVSQVAEAEQRWVEQSLLSDWRESRKLQEVRQNLSLLMEQVVGRHVLQKREQPYQEQLLQFYSLYLK